MRIGAATLWLRASVTALLVTGCRASGAPVYSPPAASEPQAIAELRTRYSRMPWRELVEWVELNGARLPGGEAIVGGYARRVGVRPGLATWSVDASFYVSHMETQQRTVPHAFACGPNGAMCTAFMTVPVEVQVNTPVAACRASRAAYVLANERYVLQFDMVGHGQCQLACYRVGASGAGLEPCPPLPAWQPMSGADARPSSAPPPRSTRARAPWPRRTTFFGGSALLRACSRTCSSSGRLRRRS